MLREYLYFSEGGPLCTKQASQRSRFCTAISRSTEGTAISRSTEGTAISRSAEGTALAGLLCTQQTIFTEVSNPPQPAQADDGQGRRSMYTESLVETVGGGGQ
jgi:hypothetical protein